MGYCQIITFKNGLPDKAITYRNPWGGSAYIWTTLFDKYLKDFTKDYDSWLSSESNRSKLWDLPNRQDLAIFVLAVLLSTFDRAIIKRENFKTFAEHLRKFVKVFPPKEKNVCHLISWAEDIEKIEVENDCEAIGFYGTSVGENLWFVSKENEDDNKFETIPYNINIQKDHFEIYEWLKSKGHE